MRRYYKIQHSIKPIQNKINYENKHIINVDFDFSPTHIESTIFGFPKIIDNVIVKDEAILVSTLCSIRAVTQSTVGDVDDFSFATMNNQTLEILDIKTDVVANSIN